MLVAHIAMDEAEFYLRLREDGQLVGDIARDSLPAGYENCELESREEDRVSDRVT